MCLRIRGVRNVRFSENLTSFVSGNTHFEIQPFALLPTNFSKLLPEFRCFLMMRLISNGLHGNVVIILLTGIACLVINFYLYMYSDHKCFTTYKQFKSCGGKISVIYIWNHESYTLFRLWPQWLCGNSCCGYIRCPNARVSMKPF